MLSFVHGLFPSTMAETGRQLSRTYFVSSSLCPVPHLRLPSRRPRFAHGSSQRTVVHASISDAGSDANKFTETGEIAGREASNDLGDGLGHSIGRDGNARSDENSNASTAREPVEDGVTLPDVSAEELRVESSWLEIEIRSWLDDEWRSAEAWTAHRGIAHRTAQLYERLRAERVNDLSTLMLGLGSGLEGGSNSVDFSNAYVDPWTIANKAAELVLARFHPDRAAQIQAEEQTHQESKPWSYLEETLRDLDEAERAIENGEATGTREKDTIPDHPVSPNLADKFERYRFLQMVLEGTASKPLIDGAVAIAMGYSYDISSDKWNAGDVEDGHFQQFGDVPPDVLGDEQSSQWTDTLHYLNSQLLKREEEQDQFAEALQVIIETLHGFEITKIRQNDEEDHAFKKRSVVAKWLHVFGGF